MMLRGNLEFTLEDGGIVAYADSKRIKAAFDPNRFRPAEVPILLSDTTKIENLGFNAKCSLKDVVNDQLNHYLSEKERKG